jgi:hypothetical protein
VSDDDLWRRPQDPHEAELPQEDHASPADEAVAHDSTPVSDETQPITGTGGSPTPPSPPAGTPYAAPSGPGAVPPPVNPYGQATGQQAQPGWNPYADPGAPYQQAAPPPQPTTPYPQGPYGGAGYLPPQNPYARPHEYGEPQNPYGSPYQPAYAGGLAQNHPTATTAMVLGIIGLASIAICAGVLLVVSPVAWILGGQAVKEIDASRGRYAGRDRAQAGRVMGIIGTVLLVLGVLAIVLVIVAAVHSDQTIQPSNDQNF